MKRVGYEVGQVKAVAGVPRWVTFLMHLMGRRYCRKVGHASPYVCIQCGLILEKAILSDRELAAMHFDVMESDGLLTSGIPQSGVDDVRSRYVEIASANPRTMLELRKWAKENGLG